MKEKLTQIRTAALAEITAAQSPAELEALRVRYLGKKGELTAILKQTGGLSAEERPAAGALANTVRSEIETALDASKSTAEASALAARLLAETLDVTLPGRRAASGRRHPMGIVADEVKDIFIGMGFRIAEGPEVEYAEYDFDKLNIPPNHTVREWSDTFYITEDESVHLRCQTSPVQVRYMEAHRPPIRIISPGRVYRKDEVDATHSPMFHQVEGLVVDHGITLGDLKGTLNALVGKLYGGNTKTRFRPHHFPFTEPSCEVDVECFVCHGASVGSGSGCRVCHGEGWLELLGSGMVHPKVLAGAGIDPDEYSGFAFGVGLERLTLLRYGIDDMRLLFENDMRFLSQF
ncbi:MAG: phenylalanine--tRNA ligase subunit alpha [Oscillospiraceae bacterium]|jgi:phenylalanyl-tRNA synthetase alpha chain|nr:phenylalanine--tRNA ligase subunit alpha [Oscillospiraceae bacterium]